ncbi:hypothetical protein P7K49_009683 [Saguinus oedipus]|uniref:Uncharacterized protein n=1 Tax=Saguinus oedipus TaxID=9490 RepID=A0ABQ9VKN4_SAGOE|nr:hypothetical protein P7K49_009683 [Saguinus oedipus]
MFLPDHMLSFPGCEDKEWDSKANPIGFSKCSVVQMLTANEALNAKLLIDPPSSSAWE